VRKPETILTYDHECKTNTKRKGHEITWFLPTCLNAYSWGAKFSVHQWAGNGGPNSRLDVAPSRNGKVGGGFIHREGPPWSFKWLAILSAFKQQAKPVLTFKGLWNWWIQQPLKAITWVVSTVQRKKNYNEYLKYFCYV
jgi:hypothetical protein